MQDLEGALKKYWGHDVFRPVQRAAIESVLGGRDTLVLMPTGGGKSLLYQLPGIVSPGVCIVVTPLIALMKDQVDRLRRRGISAVAIHSGLSARQIDMLLDNCVYGDVKFLYIAPERIPTEVFRMRVQRMKVSLIAVDEAHCISQWGYDFRPSYLRIAELRKAAPGVPVLALTASATPGVVDDIRTRLEMKDGAMMRSPFARPNLSYTVRLTEDKPTQLLRILNNVPGPGIVYVRTREGTVQVARMLAEQGIAAGYYHGGLPSNERGQRQDAWMSGAIRIMVATNAFGMGIDKADVRVVVHYDIPDSIEEYYQEAGRAGRDGRRSYAVLLTSPDDRGRAVRRFTTEFPTMELIRECYEAIFNYLQIGIGDGKWASFEFNLYEFSSRHKFYPASAMNAIKVLEQNGYMQLTEPADLPARIMFTVSRDDLYRIRIEREELDHILRVILRLYNGVFHGFVAIDEAQIAAISGYTVERVKELLSRLWNLRVIRYIPGGNSPLLILTEERLPTGDLRIAPESYGQRKQMATERLEAMFAYADNPVECRSAVMQRYFGEKDPADCGVCDICLLKRKSESEHFTPYLSVARSHAGDILKALADGPLDPKALVSKIKGEAAAVVAAVDALLAENEVTTGADGKISLK
ncbi:MAG: RecQ family ATP-dependent DNA helicase [Rikenellaceae bacterium]|jgi:ATP-dependent DNA helicase RecQ|nr:RecQ family ATP-dependent DNA helicase [Rikenellaceae bacterium]